MRFERVAKTSREGEIKPITSANAAETRKGKNPGVEKDSNEVAVGQGVLLRQSICT